MYQLFDKIDKMKDAEFFALILILTMVAIMLSRKTRKE